MFLHVWDKGEALLLHRLVGPHPRRDLGGEGGGVEVGLGHIVALNLAAATQNAQSSRKHLSLLSMMHKPS